MINFDYQIKQNITTNKSLEDVTEAAVDQLSQFGGDFNHLNPGAFNINEGKNGILGGFCSKYSSEIRIKQRDNKFEIKAKVMKSPNILFWICAPLGLIIFIPWIANLVYFISNPTSKYQSALSDIDFNL